MDRIFYNFRRSRLALQQGTWVNRGDVAGNAVMAWVVRRTIVIPQAVGAVPGQTVVSFGSAAELDDFKAQPHIGRLLDQGDIRIAEYIPASETSALITSRDAMASSASTEVFARVAEDSTANTRTDPKLRKAGMSVKIDRSASA